MSLRTRWAMTLAGLVAAAVGIGLAASLVFIEGQLRRQVDTDLTERVAVLPVDLRSFLGQNFGALAGRRRPIELDAVIQLVRSDGTVLGLEAAPVLPVEERDRALADGRGEPFIRTVEVGDVPYRMITASFDSPRLQGAVQIAVDISGTERALSALRRRLMVMWLAASAVAGLVGWLAARRAVGPIERLTEAAEHVAATESLDVELDTQAPAEIGRLATAFSSMLTALSRSREQQARLASDAGHEFRTPLTALRTNLETLDRRADDLSPGQRKELLDAAISEVGELSVLSAELVDLASDAGRSQESTRSVDLFELVSGVADLFKRRVSQPLEVSGSGEIVEARPLQLERAVSNMIDNARKWSPADAPIEITVDGRSVQVRDHGPGISEEDLPHVFDRFYRSVDSRTTPGSGLGLAIVETIVEGHSGTVTVSNHPEGGAVVGFRV